MGDVSSFFEYCQPELDFMTGPRCDASSTTVAAPSREGGEVPLTSYARLCFAFLDLVDLELGAKLLIERFRTYMETKAL
jgi:hypothetical protein